MKPEIVRASAGTGKTFELSNKYLHLLARGEKPDRILATTFTKKAAGEIRARIFSRLATACISEKEASALAEFIQIPELTKDRAQELLEKLVHAHHTLRVCTLDSFFVQIAQSFSLELGLSPKWELATDQRENNLMMESVSELFREGKDQLIRDIAIPLAQGDLKRKLFFRFVAEVRELLALYKEASDTAWSALPVPQEPQETVEQLCLLLEGLQAPKTKKGDPSKRWLALQEKDRLLLEEGNVLEMLKSGLLANIAHEQIQYYKQDAPPEWIDLYQKILSYARSKALAQLRARTESTMNLLRSFEPCFQKISQQQALIRYDDIKTALGEASVMQEIEHLYYRLDCAISHVLLDEFQDTSSVEWNVMLPIIDEIASKASSEHSLFVVGDVKQAIYGWRGGVAEVFDTLEERCSHIEVTSREHTYRCDKEIIAFVNQLFSNLNATQLNPHYEEAFADWSNQFSEHTSASSDDGFVQICTYNPLAEEIGSDDRVVTIAQILKTIPKDKTVGILVRTNDQVADLVHALSMEPWFIKASQEGGRPLTDSAAVSVFLALLQLIEHPRDSVALFHLTHSFIGQILGFTEDLSRSKLEAKIALFRSMIWTNGLADFLSTLIAQVHTKLSDREHTRVRQFLELAIDHSLLESGRLSEFIQRVQREPKEESSSSLIRVMTIHKSKGLEFDVTILTETDAALVRPMISGCYAYREKRLEPPTVISRAAPEYIRAISPELQLMHKQREDEMIRESLSLLYVAITRAKSALYIIGPRKEIKKGKTVTFWGVITGALCLDPQASEILYTQGDANYSKIDSSIEESLDIAEVSSLEKLNLEDNSITGSECLGKDRGQKRQSVPSYKRGIPRVLPSQLAKDEDFLLQLDLGHQKGRLKGDIFHKIVSQFDWIKDQSDVDVVIQSFTTLLGSVDQDIAQLINKWLHSKNLHSLLSKERYQDWELELKVYNEHKLAKLENNLIKTGICDRLVVGFLNGKAKRAQVIDFKTDTIHPGDTQRELELLEKYKPQVELYKELISVTYEIPIEAVSASIYFCQIENDYSI